MLLRREVADCSVVIPAHNAAGFLEAALESVFAQSLPPAEVIVVDDGSTDGTCELVARDDRVQLISLPVKSGPSRARNRGIHAATQSYVAFLDADDLWHPGHLERAIELLACSSAGLSFAPVETFGNVSTVVVPPCPADTPLALTAALLDDNFIIQSSVVARRDLLCASSGYDESLGLAEDYDLWLRLSCHCTFIRCADVTVKRRLHRGQASDVRRLEMVNAAWRIRHHWLHSTEGRGALPQAAARTVLERAADRELEWAVWSGDAQQLARVREVLVQHLQSIGVPLPLALRPNVLGGVIRSFEDFRCATRQLKGRVGVARSIVR
ncbi:MAG: glycosyltransferase family 2 protein [Gemmatimonadaceae bacterium]|nr:glycosyltransferase family 2 protein [Gemmatimonadaceae bacterium]